MNWPIKIIWKTLMTKIPHISWEGYDKGFYGNLKFLFVCLNAIIFKKLLKSYLLGFEF